MAPDPGRADATRTAEELASLLQRIDGRGYKAYKALEGAWSLGPFALRVDHVQGDPYAAPTRVRAWIEPSVASLPGTALRSASRRLGVAAFLARAFAEAAGAKTRDRGAGRSGEIGMEHPGQKTLPQTAVMLDEAGGVEARFTLALPAEGRRVSGDQAATMMLGDVPELVRSTLLWAAHAPAEIEAHAAANEDATALRDRLAELGLVAFVADGARLPRRSGIDDRPLADEDVVMFESPPRLRVEAHLPNAGRVRGMGVPPGVTLIVGGGFHGKSTLLHALEAGVYNHRPRDGRELVVTRADAVKVRAEEGRSIAGVDISPFIDGLPRGRDTHRFSSADASGSTSQAAAIVEALEAGSRLLLVDEDTSATNFMIRDRRMQLLVPGAGEPIIPFVDRVRDLHQSQGVSCVIVIGGSGDYLDVADTVVRMADYRPHDVTSEAREVAATHPTGRVPERPSLPPGAARRLRPASRSLVAGTLDARRGHRSRYVRVPDDRTILFGDEAIDLVAVEQLANRAQMRSIGAAMAWLAERLGTVAMPLPAALDLVETAVDDGGLDALEPWLVGDLAAFRRHELAAALNRLRSLRVV